MDGSFLQGPFRLPEIPRRLIFDGEHIWALQERNNAPDVVSRLSQDGQVLDTFTVGLRGGDLVSDGEGIWVATSEEHQWSGGYHLNLSLAAVSTSQEQLIPTTGALWKITPD